MEGLGNSDQADQGQEPEEKGPFIELTEEEDWLVDHLVHTKPTTYYDAIFEATGKRIVRETVEPPVEAPKEERPRQKSEPKPKRFERKPHPALSAREKEIADRRPDLKPRPPRLAPDSEYGLQDNKE